MGYYLGHPYAYAVPHPVPVVAASNVCKNEAGTVVPCALGVVPGSALYGFPHALHFPGGVATAAPPDAEADPYLLYANYYGGYGGYRYPFYGYGYGLHGYYGRGYGYGYGYYGYPGYGYYYGK